MLYLYGYSTVARRYVIYSIQPKTRTVECAMQLARKVCICSGRVIRSGIHVYPGESVAGGSSSTLVACRYHLYLSLSLSLYLSSLFLSVPLVPPPPSRSPRSASKTIGMTLPTVDELYEIYMMKKQLQYSTAQHSTAQHSTAQHSTAQHSTAKQSKAKQSKAKQSKAKQSKAKQSKAKQSKAKQSKAQYRVHYNVVLCFCLISNVMLQMMYYCLNDVIILTC